MKHLQALRGTEKSFRSNPDRAGNQMAFDLNRGQSCVLQRRDAWPLNYLGRDVRYKLHSIVRKLSYNLVSFPLHTLHDILSIPHIMYKPNSRTRIRR